MQTINNIVTYTMKISRLLLECNFTLLLLIELIINFDAPILASMHMSHA